MFSALLLMKLSSSSESESRTLGWESGSDAGLFLPVFLVGNVRATFRTLDLQRRLGGSESTFFKIKKNIAIYSTNWKSCNMLRLCISYHGFHLTVNHILLKPAARVFFWCRFRDLWFERRPPGLSQAAPLNTNTQSSVADAAAKRLHTPQHLRGYCTYGKVCCRVVTVLAKPPSEPKLSQLSSEEAEEEDDVSMGTSGTLRKLLRFILVDGGWTASFCKAKQVCLLIYN